MFNLSATDSPEDRTQTTIARKLIQAAALAAVLVPLGTVAAGAAPINCVTTGNEGSGFCEADGNYIGGEGEQSNTWKFFADGNFEHLIYTLDITGVPTSTFTLGVRDFVTSQNALLDGTALSNFPNDVCLPTFSEGRCGLFDVSLIDGEVEWELPDGYYMTITWFTNEDPLSQPPDDGQNRILRAPDFFQFTEALGDTTYDPAPTPTDPALGGRGDSFSRFGAFRTIPEPATLLLFGAGIATALYRTRRRKEI